MQGIRRLLVENLQPSIFLISYFLTVVLGNLIFASPVGRDALEYTGLPTVILDFQSTFGWIYWIVLLSPFVVTPVIVYFTKRHLKSGVSSFLAGAPEFTFVEYLTVTIFLYAFVFSKYLSGAVFQKSLTGNDAVGSVRARLEILASLGPAPLITIQAILSFLTVYSVIRYLRNMREKKWGIVSIANVVIMTTLLLSLNMKWPVIIFMGALVLTLFVYSPKFQYLFAIVGTVLLGVIYVAVTSLVWRIVPETSFEPSAAMPVNSATPTEAPPNSGGNQNTSWTQLFGYVPRLFLYAVFRMAYLVPNYIEAFSTEGVICGGLQGQLGFGVKCRPSTYIYVKMFGDDGFAGVGTAPSAAHITSLVLGGLLLSLLALILVSIVLGLLASLPVETGAFIPSLAIIGALAGYHFSQLPIEGPFIYDHGLLWTVGFMYVFYVYKLLRRKLSSSWFSQRKAK